MKTIKTAIEQAGGTSVVARSLEVSAQVICNWAKRGQVPASHVIRFEEVTGMSRHDLRPDIFGAAPEQRAA